MQFATLVHLISNTYYARECTVLYVKAEAPMEQPVTIISRDPAPPPHKQLKVPPPQSLSGYQSHQQCSRYRDVQHQFMCFI